MVRNRVLSCVAVVGLAVSVAGCEPVGYGLVAPVYADGYYGAFAVPVYAGGLYGGYPAPIYAGDYYYYGGYGAPVYAGGHYYGGVYRHRVYYLSLIHI